MRTVIYGALWAKAFSGGTTFCSRLPTELDWNEYLPMASWFLLSTPVNDSIDQGSSSHGIPLGTWKMENAKFIYPGQITTDSVKPIMCHFTLFSQFGEKSRGKGNLWTLYQERIFAGNVFLSQMNQGVFVVWLLWHSSGEFKDTWHVVPVLESKCHKIGLLLFMSRERKH